MFMNFAPPLPGNINTKSSKYKGSRKNPSPVIIQNDLNLTKCQQPRFSLNKPNKVGIISGVSELSTMVFKEKLAWWSSIYAKENIPFIVCSDPVLHNENSRQASLVEDLILKRRFLEQSGACCIVMPCHISHAWYDTLSNGCSVPFFHIGDCVATELKKAKLKPLESGQSVRIGVLAAAHSTSTAALYQEKLRDQGFEVILPDKTTMEHILKPAIQAQNRGDVEGARNLLRIAVQLLLVKAVNTVILASDEIQCLLPDDDPLLRKCINPMDSLARSAIQWTKSSMPSDKSRKLPMTGVIS